MTCSFCNSVDTVTVGRFPTNENKIVTILECINCKSLNIENSHKNQGTQVAHHESSWNNLNKKDYLDLKNGMLDLLNHYSRFINKNGLALDVGFGRGNLVAACKEQFNSVMGCEPSKLLFNKAIINYDLNENEIYCENSDSFYLRCLKNEKKASAIFFWHTLEHIQNSLKVLDAYCKNLLCDDGVIFIQLPGLSRQNVFLEHNFLATAELFQYIECTLNVKLIDFSIETKTRFYTGIFSKSQKFNRFNLPIPYKSLNQFERLLVEYDRMLSDF